MDTTAQIKKVEAERPEMCPKIKGEPLAPEKMNQTNAIARRTAIKLLALCCPGPIPESSMLTQVPALETQYRNAEKTLKFFHMGGGGDRWE